jgi:hypothetical protein
VLVVRGCALAGTAFAAGVTLRPAQPTANRGLIGSPRVRGPWPAAASLPRWRAGLIPAVGDDRVELGPQQVFVGADQRNELLLHRLIDRGARLA